MKRFFKPILDIPVDQINADHIAHVLNNGDKSLWHHKHQTAEQLRGFLREIFEDAIEADCGVNRNPVPASKKRAIRKYGAPKKIQREAKHHKALPQEKVSEAIQTIRNSTASDAAKLAFEFKILTACRTAEVLEGTWDEIDLEKGEWLIGKNKQDNPHLVPLSKQAVELLRRAASTFYGPWKADFDFKIPVLHLKGHRSVTGPFKYWIPGLIFPGNKHTQTYRTLQRNMRHPEGEMVTITNVRKTAMSRGTLPGILRSNGIDCHMHGFRANFRTWASQTGIDFVVAELCLGHDPLTNTQRSYDRHLFLEERREAMQKWADFIDYRKEGE